MPERYLGQTLGKYRVDSLIGTGGFAWVFKGFDPELEIPVAIKVLKPQFAGDSTLMERFRREAATAAKLRHPNIVKIYAVGRQGDAVYFVMDYLPGGLADKLEATPCLPEEYVLRVGVDVANALGFAHREGVIHRDIKVDNILFDAHGNAVVADFGIARAVSGYTQQTGTNMVVGTPQYFAPEQARAKPLDGRADLYSLGVTLFRAATGRLPFEGEDWYEIARQHVEEPPPPPRSIVPTLSEDFERVVLRCLAKNPDERPATGEQLGEELRAVLAKREDPTGARTVSVPAFPFVPSPVSGQSAGVAVASASRGRRRRYLPSAIASLVLVVAITAALWPRITQRLGWGLPVDSLPGPDTAGAPKDSTLVMGGEDTTAPVVPPQTRPVPSGSTKAPVTPAAQRNSLVVTAPAGAVITLNDIAVGIGPTTLDTLPAGEYTVVAMLPAINGCSWARQVTVARLRGSPAPTRVTLAPRACGTLEIDGRAPPGPGELQYRLESLDGSTVRVGALPLEVALVLPEGQYRLRATKPRCFDYNGEVTITPGATERVTFTMACAETLGTVEPSGREIEVRVGPVRPPPSQRFASHRMRADRLLDTETLPP